MKKSLSIIFAFILLSVSAKAQHSVYGFYWLSSYDVVCHQIEELIAPQKLDDSNSKKTESEIVVLHRLVPDNTLTELYWVFMFDKEKNALKNIQAYYYFNEGKTEKEREITTSFILSSFFLDAADEVSHSTEKNEKGELTQVYDCDRFVLKCDAKCISIFFKRSNKDYTSNDLYNLGLITEKYGTPEGAFSWFGVSALKGSKQATYKMANYYASGKLGDKDYATAVELLESVLPIADSNGNEYWLLGHCYKDGGYGISKNTEKAKSYYLKGIAKKNVLCCNDLAYLYASQKLYSQAISTIDKAISFSPNDFNFYDTKGEICLMMGDANKAKTMWEKASSLAGNQIEWLKNNSNLYKQLKEKGQIVVIEDKLLRIRKQGKYGYINKEGKEVIPCKWEDAASFFSEGLASVKNDQGKWGYINKEGKVVIPCKWKNTYVFSEGLASVKNDQGKWGYINKEGNEVIPCKWKFACDFSEGLARVKNEQDKWGYINKEGIEIIPCKWKDARNFSEGLACVRNEQGKLGYINKEGKEVIPCKWKYAFDFSEGLARVKNDQGKWGYINKEGKV